MAGCLCPGEMSWDMEQGLLESNTHNPSRVMLALTQVLSPIRSQNVMFLELFLGCIEKPLTD